MRQIKHEWLRTLPTAQLLDLLRHLETLVEVVKQAIAERLDDLRSEISELEEVVEG